MEGEQKLHLTSTASGYAAPNLSRVACLVTIVCGRAAAAEEACQIDEEATVFLCLSTCHDLTM